MEKKDRMTQNIFSEHIFKLITIVLMVLIVILMMYTGFREIGEFKSMFEDHGKAQHQIGSYSYRYLQFTRIAQPSGTKLLSDRFVTITDLSYPSSIEKQRSEIEETRGLTKMTGLVTHPSFLILESNESFWRSQYYWMFAFHLGGITTLVILMMSIVILITRKKKKLFTPEVKKLFYAIYFLIVAGFFTEAFLYGRMIHFINEQYYLGESLTAGISPEFAYIFTVLLLVIVMIENAIPMQHEQDLTI